MATTSSLERAAALADERITRACALTARRAGRPLLLCFLLSKSLCSWCLAQIHPFLAFFLFLLSLPPTLVPALLLLHGDQRSPCTSTSTKPTFVLTRTLLPATRAAAAMLSAVVMTRMSCPLHQLWQGVFRGHNHGIKTSFSKDVPKLPTVWICNQCFDNFGRMVDHEQCISGHLRIQRGLKRQCTLTYIIYEGWV